MPRPRFLFSCLLISTALLASDVRPCAAQGGGFIEDMFRTIAEAQLEREQRKRMEAEREPELPPTELTKPSEIPVPPNVFPPGPLGLPRPGNTAPGSPAPSGRVNPRPSSTPNDRANDPLNDARRPAPTGRPESPDRTNGSSPRNAERRADSRPTSVTVRTQEAATFVNQLVAFYTAADALTNQLRSQAATTPGLRPRVPTAYRVTADSRTLIEACDGLADPQTLSDQYADLDARWRQLSFALRSFDGLESSCSNSVRQCDRAGAELTQILGLQPQFDRIALEQVMHTAAVYMQALLDDLTLVPIDPRERESLTRDVRVLREQLLASCTDVRQASYEEVVSRFTEFAGRWRGVGERLGRIGDPHIQARLDRISQCGTETYALVWMPAPISQVDYQAAATSIRSAAVRLLDQLSARSLVGLPANDQVRMLDTARRLDESTQEFVNATRNPERAQRPLDQLGAIQRVWQELRPRLSRLQTIDPRFVADLDRAIAGHAGAGIGSVVGAQLDYERLTSFAAALEGSAAYFLADVQRYERYFQPESYRRDLVTEMAQFHQSATQLHLQLGRFADLATIQSEAETALRSFDRVNQLLSEVDRHGLSGGRLDVIRRGQSELTPLIAQIAAALLDR